MLTLHAAKAEWIEAMKTDTQLQQEVLDALLSHQSLDSTYIGVGAWNGIITLVGHVSSLEEKLEVEHIAQLVSGGMGVNMEINIRPR